MTIRSLALVAMAGLAAGEMSAQPLQVVQVANVPGGYLGVMPTDVNAERAKSLKLPEEAGVEITQLDPAGPAALAGLKIGDVVTQYNGQRVEGNEQFSRMVRETPAGRDVKLQVYRNGAVQIINAKVGPRPAPTIQGALIPGVPLGPSMPGTLPDIALSRLSWRIGVGAEVESLEGPLADYFGVQEGVLVRSVLKGSPAERAGLKAGDVITRVGDAKVVNAADLSPHIRAGRGQSAVVTVMRDHRELNLTIALDGNRAGDQF
jgi:serine protease Do